MAFATAAVGTSLAGEQEEVFQRLWGNYLPEYCLYTQARPDREPGLYGTPKSKEYAKLYGSAFHHMHHYCWGLDETYRALSEEEEQLRKGLYQSAINDFDYILLRSPDDFVLKPEIYVNKGAALEALGRCVDAVEAYTEALLLRSDYVPAYIGLSNCFEALGDPQRALTVVESGLQQVPGSELLLERRLALTGRVSVRSN